MKKMLIGVGLALVLVAIVYIYRNPSLINMGPNVDQVAPLVETAPIVNQEMPFAKTFEYTATDSAQTAMDLLKAQDIVQVKEYGFGTMVVAINGLTADERNYWAFYVNDEYAKQAADQTPLSAGDKIKFVYESVTAAPVMDDK